MNEGFFALSECLVSGRGLSFIRLDTTRKPPIFAGGEAGRLAALGFLQLKNDKVHGQFPAGNDQAAWWAAVRQHQYITRLPAMAQQQGYRLQGRFGAQSRNNNHGIAPIQAVIRRGDHSAAGMGVMVLTNLEGTEAKDNRQFELRIADHRIGVRPANQQKVIAHEIVPCSFFVALDRDRDVAPGLSNGLLKSLGRLFVGRNFVLGTVNNQGLLGFGQKGKNSVGAALLRGYSVRVYPDILWLILRLKMELALNGVNKARFCFFSFGRFNCHLNMSRQCWSRQLNS